MMKSTFIFSVLSILFVASDIFVNADNVRSTKMIRKSTTHKGKPFILDGRDGVKYECTPLPNRHPEYPRHPHHPHPHPHPHSHPHPSKSTSKVQTSTIHNSSTSLTTSTSDPTTSTTVTRSTFTRSAITPTSNTATDGTSTITSTTQTSAKLPIIINSDVTSSTLTTTASTVSSSTSSAPTNSATICPPDYTEVQQGDLYIKKGSSLIDLSGLTVDLNILNFGKNGQKEGQTIVPASSNSICSTAICCVKPNPAQCPAGYQIAKRGELFDVTKQHNGSLLDLSGLTIDLNVLTSDNGKTQKGQNGQRCEAETCCYQIDQNQSLVDANGIKIDICVLTGTC